MATVMTMTTTAMTAARPQQWGCNHHNNDGHDDRETMTTVMTTTMGP
jgi:hypothetical protein